MNIDHRFVQSLMQCTSPNASQRPHLSPQEELLLKLFECHIMELLLLVCQHAGERPFRQEAPLLLDIVHEVRSCCTHMHVEIAADVDIAVIDTAMHEVSSFSLQC